MNRLHGMIGTSESAYPNPLDFKVFIICINNRSFLPNRLRRLKHERELDGNYYRNL